VEDEKKVKVTVEVDGEEVYCITGKDVLVDTSRLLRPVYVGHFMPDSIHVVPNTTETIIKIKH